MLAQVALHLLLPGSIENSQTLVNPPFLLLFHTIVAHSQPMSLACWRGANTGTSWFKCKPHRALVYQRINNKGTGKHTVLCLLSFKPSALTPSAFHQGDVTQTQQRTGGRKGAKGMSEWSLKTNPDPCCLPVQVGQREDRRRDTNWNNEMAIITAGSNQTTTTKKWEKPLRVPSFGPAFTAQGSSKAYPPWSSVILPDPGLEKVSKV